MKILPKYLQLIKDGKKRAEIKTVYKDLSGQLVGLVTPNDNKIKLIVRIDNVYDIRNVEDEYKELLFEETGVDLSLRNNHKCNYIYTFKEIINIQ